MTTMPYHPPFRFLVPTRDPWSGARPEVRVWVRPTDPAAKDALIAQLEGFTLLAECGALGGAPLPASGSQVRVEGDRIVLILQRPRFDPRATNVLLSLLLSSGAPIQRAVIEAAPGESSEQPDVDPELEHPYLSRAELGQPRFEVEILDSEDDSRVVIVELVSLPRRELEEELYPELAYWAGPASVGAYGVAPVPPERCGCLPSTELEIDGRTVTWALDHCRFHSDAWDALVEVFVRIDRTTPISSLRIE